MPEILPPTSLPKAPRASGAIKPGSQETGPPNAFGATLASARDASSPKDAPDAPDAQGTPLASAEPAQATDEDAEAESGSVAATDKTASETAETIGAESEPSTEPSDDAVASEDDDGAASPGVIATAAPEEPEPHAVPGSTPAPKGEARDTSQNPTETADARQTVRSSELAVPGSSTEAKPEAPARKSVATAEARETKPNTKQPVAPQQVEAPADRTKKPAAPGAPPEPGAGSEVEEERPDRPQERGAAVAVKHGPAETAPERPSPKVAAPADQVVRSTGDVAPGDAATQQHVAAVSTPAPVGKPTTSGDESKPSVKKSRSASSIEPRSAGDSASPSKPSPVAEPSAPKPAMTLKPAPVQPGANQSQGASQAPPESVQQANERTMLHSVQRGLSVAMAQRGGVVNIRLAPGHLGSLRIAMTLSAGTVAAAFTASTADAAKMLQTNLDALRDSLEGRGLKVDRLSVSGPAPASDAPEARPDSNNARRDGADERGDGRSRGRGEHHQRGAGEQHQQRQQESRFSQQWRLALDATA